MKYSKEYIGEVLRVWQVPQLNELLDENILAQDIVTPNNRDILLESILRKNDILFLRIMNMPFDFNKNGFFYLHHALRCVMGDKSDIFVEKLLDNMDKESLCKKDLNNSKKTALHIACELNLQSYALLLSQKGLSWNALTTNNQTPLHLLLRNASYIEPFLIDEINMESVKIKDDMDISCKDIIKSFSFDSEWSAIKENQEVIKKWKI